MDDKGSFTNYKFLAVVRLLRSVRDICCTVMDVCLDDVITLQQVQCIDPLHTWGLDVY